MRRIAPTLALALFLLGCGSPVASFDGSGGRVQLLTDSPKLDANGNLVTGCVLMGPRGRLIVHPEFGTAIGTSPVMWPSGFTGRRIGSEIEVLDRDQHVVAVTGRTYEFLPAELGGSWFEPEGAVFKACGLVR